MLSSEPYQGLRSWYPVIRCELVCDVNFHQRVFHLICHRRASFAIPLFETLHIYTLVFQVLQKGYILRRVSFTEFPVFGFWLGRFAVLWIARSLTTLAASIATVFIVISTAVRWMMPI